MLIYTTVCMQGCYSTIKILSVLRIKKALKYAMKIPLLTPLKCA